MSANRLPHGGRVQRDKVLRFTFNGKTYTGFEGDTLASALIANGVRIVGRSFKYSRPRGIVGSGAEEPNAIMQVGEGAQSTPNLKATEVMLSEGLVARSTNGWPSVNFDIMALAEQFGGLLPPGFYYKTFMRPKRFWRFYEHQIRKMAGFGRAPTQPDVDRYDKMNHHCDVLVVGGGPAGLAAAAAAAGAGARVILADDRLHAGGSLRASDVHIDDKTPLDWVEDTIAALASLPNVQMLSNSTVFANYDNQFVTITERRPPGAFTRERIHRVRTRQLILATGAFERMPVFANNDRPGVMLASAVSTYIQRYAAVPGRQLVLFTNNDHAYQAARDWIATGRQVVAIVDVRSEIPASITEPLTQVNVPVYPGSVVIDVAGRRGVRGALVAQLDETGKGLSGMPEWLACDVVACSSGWNPIVHLASHSGRKPRWRDDIAAFVPDADPANGLLLAGSLRGLVSTAECLRDGDEAGRAAAAACGLAGVEQSFTVASVDVGASAMAPIFLVPHTSLVSRAPKQFVDLQNDVTASAIELAAREGYQSVEHVKRYTALGFGTDQGKLSNVNGVAILAQALGQGMDETGTTMFRPPYTPVSFGAVAGRDIGELLDPARLTAMHQWHEAQGAAWENVGQWKRPWYFPRTGETMQDAVNRECLAVRQSVGMLDASTLGKIDIKGSDAAEFLTRLYTNSYLKLAVGGCRYGVLLKEDGMIFDDGVIARIAEHHFIATTTTGGAAAVLQWMELWHQTEWPELDVYLTSVTDHWATVAVSGPNARRVIEQVADDISLAPDDFPFMTWRDASIDGIAVRIFRISFTGELAFEVNVPANYGRHVWEKIHAAGQPFDMTPYGTETMHVLRAEKGFVIVGQDTDGSVTPIDMGMDWIVNRRKKFSFIGKRSLDRSDTKREDRKQWVGLLPDDPAVVLPEGSQLVFETSEIPMAMVGHVTSSYYSANLERSFALAMVKGGHSRTGEKVFAPLADGRVIGATITGTVFVDPAGERQHVI